MITPEGIAALIVVPIVTLILMALAEKIAQAEMKKGSKK